MQSNQQGEALSVAQRARIAASRRAALHKRQRRQRASNPLQGALDAGTIVTTIDGERIKHSDVVPIENTGLSLRTDDALPHAAATARPPGNDV